jgi:hypothetical protein
VKPELRSIALILALPLALAGCGKSDEGKQAVAAGEVLPGSASDAMLPLDTLRSQPPLAPPVEASGAPRERKPEPVGETAPSDAASESAADEASDAAPASAESDAE